MIRYTYVEILFDIAKNEKSIDHISEQFEVLMALIDQNPDWVTMLDTPVLSNDKKFSLLDQLGLFDETFKQFLKVLIRNRNVRMIEDIYNEWLVKTRLYKSIAFVQLYCSKKPTQKQLKTIKADIAPLFPDLTIEFNIHIDHTLISGVRLYYQGKSLERSMKKELLDMRDSL